MKNINPRDATAITPKEAKRTPVPIKSYSTIKKK
jgi:hypothetical protein